MIAQPRSITQKYHPWPTIETRMLTPKRPLCGQVIPLDPAVNQYFFNI